MSFLATLITGLFNLIVAPFGAGHTIALIVLSLLTGVLMAFIFKWTQNPRAVRAAKDKLKARILEMRIYQDDPALIVSAFGHTMTANLRYLGTMIVPFLVLIVPVILIFMQLDERYGRTFLPIGGKTILSVQLKDGFDPYATQVDLEIANGVVQDSRPVRITSTREIGWRLRVDGWGTFPATLRAAGTSYTFPIVAEMQHRMIGHTREGSSFLEPLLHPHFGPIPEDSPIERVSLVYPPARYSLLFWKVHWIAIFLVYSALSALILKFVIGFEI